MFKLILTNPSPSRYSALASLLNAGTSPKFNLGRASFSPYHLLDQYEKAVGRPTDSGDFSGSSALSSLFDRGQNDYLSRIKLEEDDSGWRLVLELPGYSTKDVSVSIQDSVLEIIAQNEKFGKTHRTLSLWSGLDEQKIAGKMENGILTVELPREEKKTKKVKVE